MSFRSGRIGAGKPTGWSDAHASARKGAGPGRLMGTSDSAPRSRPTLEAGPRAGRSGHRIYAAALCVLGPSFRGGAP
jgi:hypothetical protein